MLLAAALNAGVNRGDRARTTEAADGNNPFKELFFNGSATASKSTGGVGGLPPVVVASEAIGVVDASEPSFVKNGLNEPEPLRLLKSVKKIAVGYHDESSM